MKKGEEERVDFWDGKMNEQRWTGKWISNGGKSWHGSHRSVMRCSRTEAKPIAGLAGTAAAAKPIAGLSGTAVSAKPIALAGTATAAARAFGIDATTAMAPDYASRM